MSHHSLSPNTLPDYSRALLYTLALSFPGKGKTSLLKLLRTMGVCDESDKLLDVTTLPVLLESLQAQGWVETEQRREGQYFVVPAQRRSSVLLSLLHAPDGMLRLQQINDSLPALNQWQAPSKPRALQELWLNVLGSTGERVEYFLRDTGRLFSTNDWAPQHPMQLLQSDPDGLKVFGQLSPDVREVLLEDHLCLSNCLPGPMSTSYDLALGQMGHRPSRALGQQLLEQALWRGDWETLELCGEFAPLTVGLLHLMLHGEIDEALVVLRSWLTEQRRQTKKRKIDLPPLLNALHCLALIAENDSQHHAALKQALVLGGKENYGGAYYVLNKLFERLQGNAPDLSDLKAREPVGLDGLLYALSVYWLDAPFAREQAWRTMLQDYRTQLDQWGYAWLAAEFDALISAQFGVPRHLPDLHQETGLKPLFELRQRREAWQHALDALSQLKTVSAPASPAAKKSTRLAWLLNPDHWSTQLEPREQKLGAKGQWSKGRPVALRRLMDEVDSLDFLCEQDRQAISMIQESQSYYSHAEYQLPFGVALQKLVGHPALFWHDATDVRLELETGHASLHLEAGDGQIHLRLEPQGISPDDTYYLDRQTPTRLQVFSVNADLRQIARIIGKGLSVPQSGKAQLLEAISAIAPLVPVHSDLPELAAQVDHEQADTRLYAHLLPLAEGLRLQLLVRPLAESSWFRPGHGAQNVLGERDGKPLQVSRDLAGERQALQQVLMACPGLAAANSDGQEWQLDQPQDALQVLGELQALDGKQLHCVWPEGERMRLKGRLKLNELKLGVRKQGEWFVLQGEVAFDDGKVLQLRQLLELIKASPGRFLKLDDRDWLALDDTLRKRLDELAHLADKVTDQGLRLSPLTAPILAGLAAEVGEFTADKNWQTLLKKLQSLRDYQPQLPRTLQADLRAYQHEGFIWLSRLAQWGVGACLADDMGLGKTVQILALLLQRAAEGPQLVVAPTSVTLNWQAESRRFAPQLKLRLYHQERNLDDLGPGDLVITSYGLLQQDSAAFAARHWHSVVLDEAQAIKNAQTKRAQAVMALQADFRVVATGTPLENHLGELWSLFHFINPSLLGSQESFTKRFTNPIEQGDAAARRTLKALIQPFILRRLKSQVLDELPARTEITYKVPLSEEEAHLYEALRQEAVSNVSDSAPGAARSFRILTEITRLRRFCCHPSLVMPESTLPGSKLQAFTALVEELLENGHRALVFSQYVDHLSIVRTLLNEKRIAYQYLDGSVPAKEREHRVNAFQAGIGEIFLISLKAGGSGLNLTAADYVIHLDPWWNPAVEDQASDRAYRIGQQRPVTIYRLVAENSIEEQIVGLHARKRDLADSLLEGGEVSAKLDADALLALLGGGAP